MIGDGYGEYAAVPAVQCLPVPAGVDLVDAGGLPETFCTVWTNVFERMHLQPGEMFLVQGGTSGIGITSIQLAKAFGGKVLATAGTDEKCRACLDYGADVAINYRTQDFVAGRQGVHRRAAASMRSSTWSAATTSRAQLDLLAREGRLCFVALMQRHQGRGRFRRDPAQAPDRHRLDAALAHRGGEGGDHRRIAREGLAALGAGKLRVVHLPAVPAARGSRGASPDGDRASTSARSCWCRDCCRGWISLRVAPLASRHAVPVAMG